MTSPRTFRISCDTVTLVTIYRKFSCRSFTTPRLERTLRFIEAELRLRAASAMR